MPSSVILPLTGEAILITLTTLLLAQPSFLFQPTPRQFQTWAFRTGWVVLILLFFWSILLGKVLSDYEITFYY